MEELFFSNGQTLVRTAAIGMMAYASLVVLLRISGRRTLSKMNAFDFVITVSLGSTLAAILLNRDVALAQGALALGLLIGMQYAVTWLSVRVSWLRKIFTGEPALLLYHGTFLPAAMRKSRVTEDEVRAAIRASGLEALGAVKAVVLETDGSFSVVKAGQDADVSSLDGVKAPGLGR